MASANSAAGEPAGRRSAAASRTQHSLRRSADPGRRSHRLRLGAASRRHPQAGPAVANGAASAAPTGTLHRRCAQRRRTLAHLGGRRRAGAVWSRRALVVHVGRHRHHRVEHRPKGGVAAVRQHTPARRPPPAFGNAAVGASVLAHRRRRRRGAVVPCPGPAADPTWPWCAPSRWPQRRAR